MVIFRGEGSINNKKELEGARTDTSPALESHDQEHAFEQAVDLENREQEYRDRQAAQELIGAMRGRGPQDIEPAVREMGKEGAALAREVQDLRNEVSLLGGIGLQKVFRSMRPGAELTKLRHELEQKERELGRFESRFPMPDSVREEKSRTFLGALRQSSIGRSIYGFGALASVSAVSEASDRIRDISESVYRAEQFLASAALETPLLSIGQDEESVRSREAVYLRVDTELTELMQNSPGVYRMVHETCAVPGSDLISYEKFIDLYGGQVSQIITRLDGIDDPIAAALGVTPNEMNIVGKVIRTNLVNKSQGGMGFTGIEFNGVENISAYFAPAEVSERYNVLYRSEKDMLVEMMRGISFDTLDANDRAEAHERIREVAGLYNSIQLLASKVGRVIEGAGASNFNELEVVRSDGHLYEFRELQTDLLQAAKDFDDFSARVRGPDDKDVQIYPAILDGDEELTKWIDDLLRAKSDSLLPGQGDWPTLGEVEATWEKASLDDDR
jgi:hypothetical protein